MNRDFVSSPAGSTGSLSPPRSSLLHVAGDALSRLADGAAVIAGDGRVLSCNQPFADAQGLLDRSDEAGGRMSPLLQEAVAALLAAGGGNHRLIIRRPEGERVYDLTLLPLATPLAGSGEGVGAGEAASGGAASGEAASGGQALLLARDHSLETGLRNALTLSRARYKEMVEISSDYAWETDADGTFSFVAPQGLLGYHARQLIGQPVSGLVIPARAGHPVLPFLAPTPVHRQEIWLRHASGQPVCLEISAVPLHHQDGRWLGARGICRDVTEERRSQAETAESRARDRVLGRIIRLFQREVSPENMLKAATSAITHGLSATGCQIMGTITPLVRGVSRPTLRMESSFGRIGSEHSAEVLLARLFAGDPAEVLQEQVENRSAILSATSYGDQVNGVIIAWRDFGRPPFSPGEQRLLSSICGQIGVALEQVHQHRILVDISRTDSLTGLLNRRAFYEDMQRRMRRLVRSGSCGALMYVDLDNFKQVNDQRGHDVGDEVLRRVGEILQANTRATDIVARLGGDEFAVWLEAADEAVAVRRADVFLSASVILRRYSGSKDFPLMLSIGIAVYDPAQGEDMNQFISRADGAMYAVKKRGKGNYSVAPPPAGLQDKGSR